MSYRRKAESDDDDDDDDVWSPTGGRLRVMMVSGIGWRKKAWLSGRV